MPLHSVAHIRGCYSHYPRFTHRICTFYAVAHTRSGFLWLVHFTTFGYGSGYCHAVATPRWLPCDVHYVLHTTVTFVTFSSVWLLYLPFDLRYRSPFTTWFTLHRSRSVVDCGYSPHTFADVPTRLRGCSFTVVPVCLRLRCRLRCGCLDVVTFVLTHTLRTVTFYVAPRFPFGSTLRSVYVVTFWLHCWLPLRSRLPHCFIWLRYVTRLLHVYGYLHLLRVVDARSRCYVRYLRYGC